MDPSPEELERRREWFDQYGDRASKQSVNLPPSDEGLYRCPCCGCKTLRARGYYQLKG
jgi:hypothetical protein